MATTGLVHSWTLEQGYCRGGPKWNDDGSGAEWYCLEPENNGQRPQLTSQECANECLAHSKCAAYDRVPGDRSECCLFRAGNVGNGAGGRECLVGRRDGNGGLFPGSLASYGFGAGFGWGFGAGLIPTLLLSLILICCIPCTLRVKFTNDSNQDSTGSPKPPLSAAPPAPLPPGWAEHTDQQSRRQYYHHQQSGSTSWERPGPCPSSGGEAPFVAPPAPFATVTKQQALIALIISAVVLAVVFVIGMVCFDPGGVIVGLLVVVALILVPLLLWKFGIIKCTVRTGNAAA